MHKKTGLYELKCVFIYIHYRVVFFGEQKLKYGLVNMLKKSFIFCRNGSLINYLLKK